VLKQTFLFFWFFNRLVAALSSNIESGQVVLSQPPSAALVIVVDGFVSRVWGAVLVKCL
jgi:hypothetical protein